METVLYFAGVLRLKSIDARGLAACIHGKARRTGWAGDNITLDGVDIGKRTGAGRGPRHGERPWAFVTILSG